MAVKAYKIFNCITILALFLSVNSVKSESIRILDVQIQYTIKSNAVNFVLTSPLAMQQLNNNAWVGIGFNSEPMMNGAIVVLCKSNATGYFVESYYNDNYDSEVLDPSNRAYGISNANINIIDNEMICSFTRENSKANPLYSNPFLIVAKGTMDAGGKHSPQNRMVSSATISLSNSQQLATQVAAQSTAQSIAWQSLSLLDAQIQFQVGLSYNEFILSFKLTNPQNTRNAWIGLGLNNQPAMNGASVVLCKSNETGNFVESYYNENYGSEVLDPSNRALGISNATIVFDQNTMTCSFRRDSSNVNPKYFNALKDSPYFIIAKGIMGMSDIAPHNSQNARVSVRAFRLSESVIITTTKASNTFTGYAEGSFLSDKFNLKWTDTQYSTDFVLTTPFSSSSDIYSAFGLSFDQIMGNDGVCYCTLSNGIGTVVQAYNAGRSTPKPLDPNNPSYGITNIRISYTNGNLVCSFTRGKIGQGVSNYFDINRPYYLLFAKGSAPGGSITFHGNNYLVSQGMINFQTNSTFTGSSQINSDKLKAHGALMVFTWMFLAPTGILFARPVMITVPIISLISFIVILADLRWQWVSTTFPINFAHSIIGIITISLAVIQIPIAFARPNPDHPRRYLFNYVHRSLGLTALLCSIVTLFLGVLIPRVCVGQIGWGILIGWGIWVIILPATIEILEFFFIHRKANTYEVKGDLNNAPSTQNIQMFEKIKSILLVAHLFISFSLMLSLVVVIGVADGKLFLNNSTS